LRDFSHFLHFITYEDAARIIPSSRVAVLPVGSVEQHGPSNPLGTDSIIAEALAAEACRRTGALCLPLVPVGVSFHHMSFPGTLSVSEEDLAGYVFGILKSLSRWGVKTAVIVNGHGGNLPALQVLARRAREELGVKVFIYQWWTSSSSVVEELFSEDERGHAGAAETSLVMHICGECVKTDKLVDETPSGRLGGERVYTFTYTHEHTKSGVFGRQSTANPEKGRELFERLSEDLASVIVKLRETAE